MRCNTYFSLSAQSIDDGTELGRRRHYRRTLVNLFRAGALADTVELPGIRRDRRSSDVMLFDRRGKKETVLSYVLRAMPTVATELACLGWKLRRRIGLQRFIFNYFIIYIALSLPEV
jgi:hypothetical protein